MYMVTYRNPECVKNNLDTLFATLGTNQSVPKGTQINLTIINNHSAFVLPEEYKKQVWVKDNLRVDESCGHLARDWNYALIDGFRSLKNPRADQVICFHDDVIWLDNWLDKLYTIHQTYDFYMADFGCTLHSYLPSAVRKIGLWDERFCNIAYHEADYQLRARIYNGDKSSINDHEQGRVWNPTEVIVRHPPHNADKTSAANESLNYHPISRKVFEKKWRRYPERWERQGEPPKQPYIDSYMNYPYFEKDVETLTLQKYVQAWAFDPKWHDVNFTTDDTI
jgi:hypothetical protein